MVDVVSRYSLTSLSGVTQRFDADSDGTEDIFRVTWAAIRRGGLGPSPASWFDASVTEENRELIEVFIASDRPMYLEFRQAMLATAVVQISGVLAMSGQPDIAFGPFTDTTNPYTYTFPQARQATITQILDSATTFGSSSLTALLTLTQTIDDDVIIPVGSVEHELYVGTEKIGQVFVGTEEISL